MCSSIWARLIKTVIDYPGYCTALYRGVDLTIYACEGESTVFFEFYRFLSRGSWEVRSVALNSIQVLLLFHCFPHNSAPTLFCTKFRSPFSAALTFMAQIPPEFFTTFSIPAFGAVETCVMLETRLADRRTTYSRDYGWILEIPQNVHRKKLCEEIPSCLCRDCICSTRPLETVVIFTYVQMGYSILILCNREKTSRVLQPSTLRESVDDFLAFSTCFLTTADH